jgi:virginiamycin B lyase
MRLLAPLAALPLLVADDLPIAARDAAAWRPDVAHPTAPPVLRAPSDSVVITEWTVPWERSRPRDPFVDSRSGDIFFVGQVGNYVARFSPKTGEFRRYELEDGALPHNVIVGPDGMVWYAGNGNGHIGRMDPETGKVTRFPMPDSAARDPHTLLFGGDDTLWFTVQMGNFVGRLTPSTGEVRLLAMPTPRARPYGIVLDSKKNPWIVEFGTNRIATIDPATMQLREHMLPDAAARPRRIAITPDDMVWYVDYARGYLGRLNPGSGKVDEWPMPGGAQSRPYAMTTDDRGRLWAVETGVQPNRLVGFDPASSRFFSVTPIGTAARNTVRHMVWHAPTRSIWFGTDANTIGRATIP